MGNVNTSTFSRRRGTASAAGSSVHEAFDVLVENLVGPRMYLDAKDWMNLRDTCTTLRDVCDRQTTRVVSCGSGTTELVTLFQWGMASETEPRFYISLRNANNVSRSYAWKGGTAGTTHWGKIRFNPQTMMVHTGDYTFAKTTNRTKRRYVVRTDPGENAVVPDLGELAPPQTVNVGESMIPYATCLGGYRPNSDCAISIVDLTGTKFAVHSRFHYHGYCANGSWWYSHNDQYVLLTGGGFPGWTVSQDHPTTTTTNTTEDHPGSWALKLKLVKPADATNLSE